MNRLAVLGGGSWGTALAIVLARGGHEVTLWSRDENAAAVMQRDRENAEYLPGARLPDGVRVTASLPEAIDGARLVVGAVPSSATRSVARAARASLGPGTAWLSATKGVEAGTHARMSQVVATEAPDVRIAVLSGPSFAREVAASQPTAVVIAASDADCARELQELVSGPTFRAYRSSDVIGVELGGAFKNVVAIAAGLLGGLGLGHDPLAALVTRGLHEMTRVAVSLGADARTLVGLSGLGDLVLTSTSALSRNWRLGAEIGRGRSLEEALESLGQVAEGVDTTRRMVELAEERGVEAPIAAAVATVLDGTATPKAAIDDLMSRRLKDETE